MSANYIDSDPISFLMIKPLIWDSLYMVGVIISYGYRLSGLFGVEIGTNQAQLFVPLKKDNPCSKSSFHII